MRYTWMDGYLLAKQGVTKDLQADGQVPDDILQDMLDKSYALVLGGLTKKQQREILGDA